LNSDVFFKPAPLRSHVLGPYHFKSQFTAGLFPFLQDCLRDRVATHPATWPIVFCRIITIYGPDGCGSLETSRAYQGSVVPIEMGECFRVSTSEPLKLRFLSNFGDADIEYISRPANTAVGAERKLAACGLDRTALYRSLDVQGRASVVVAGPRSE